MNVKNGRDQPHRKTNGKNSKKPTAVHFTYTVTTAGCRVCGHSTSIGSNFCPQCGARTEEDVRMSENKRMMQQEEETHPPFQFEVDRATAAAAVKAKAKAAASAPTLRLNAAEVAAVLPSTSREEKKALRSALVEEERKEAFSAFERYHEGGEGYLYSEGRMPGVSTSSSSSAIGGQHPVLPRAQGQPIPPDPKSDKPKPVKEKELMAFRRKLYDEQCDGGRLTPSGAAPAPTEFQSKCSHPFDSLRWSANADGHYARCKTCDLKHVIYWSVRHGVMMVANEDMVHDAPKDVPTTAKVWLREDEAKFTQRVIAGGPKEDQICCRITKDVYGQVLDITKVHKGMTEEEWRKKVPGGPRRIVTEFWYLEENHAEAYESSENLLPIGEPGLAIADSGCRNAVGGAPWHEKFQKELKKHHVPWSEVGEHELYRFGAGEAVVSNKAFLYPVMIHGKPDVIRMSCVDGEARMCPGLIGPSELSRWEAVFRFGAREMELCGVKRPMSLTPTRHPGIHLMSKGEEEHDKLQQFWHSQEGEERKKVLSEVPHTLSFIAQDGEGEASTEQEESSSNESQEDTTQPDEEWLELLEKDLGVKMIPAAEDEEGSEAPSTEVDEEEDESTDHEQGIEVVSDNSEDEAEAEEEAEERHEAYVAMGKEKKVHKGLRKKLGHCVNVIKDCAEEEAREKSSKKTTTPLRPVKSQQEKKRPEKRRWSILEVFTWTATLSIMAAARGWTAHEPITLPHWDLLKDEDYNSALEYIDRVDPDLLVLAWPCTVWSKLKGYGKQTPYRRVRLVMRRKEQRKLLRFVRDAAQRQRRRNKAVVGENPHGSLA